MLCYVTLRRYVMLCYVMLCYVMYVCMYVMYGMYACIAMYVMYVCMYVCNVM